VFNIAQTDCIEQGYELPDVMENAYLASLTGIDSSAAIRNQAAYPQNRATAIKADTVRCMQRAGQNGRQTS
jgi:hypothetical protein